MHGVDFADRLCAALTHMGLTHQEAANRLGTSQAAVSYLACGRSSGFRAAPKIAAVLGLPVDWLRDGVESSAPEWARDIYRIERDLREAEQAIATAGIAEVGAAQERFRSLSIQLADRLGRRKAERIVSHLTVELPSPAEQKRRVALLESQLAAVTAERDRLRVDLAEMAQRFLRLAPAPSPEPPERVSPYPPGTKRSDRLKHLRPLAAEPATAYVEATPIPTP